MTTNIEQEFYKVFGINKQCMCPYFPEYKESGCEICIKYFQGKKDCNDKNQYRYPSITSGKLLEMICVLNKEAVYGYSDWGGNFVIGETVEELKESILTDCIRNKRKVYNQVQQLFKDGEE